MEAVSQAQEKAKKQLQVADHMLTQTYPLVQDPKLLLSIVESLYASLQEAVAAMIAYEHYHKRLSSVPTNFEGQLNTFKLELANRYKIKADMINFVHTVKQSIKLHKESPVEFSRKNTFVMCTKDYKTKVLTVKELKGWVAKGKEFMTITEQIIGGTR
tara:strand:+ start:784 stop:1257 length:474 start_codon:yes stop_codon:yes gene_type:complete